MDSWRWRWWGLSLLGKRGDTGVRAELEGWSGVSAGIDADSDSEGWGRIQNTAESIGRNAIGLTPGREHWGPLP